MVSSFNAAALLTMWLSHVHQTNSRPNSSVSLYYVQWVNTDVLSSCCAI